LDDLDELELLERPFDRQFFDLVDANDVVLEP
jgi:hypothetical protein